MSVLEGCEGNRRTPVPEDIPCPNCGNSVEVFKLLGRIFKESECQNCGYVIKPEVDDKE